MNESDRERRAAAVVHDICRDGESVVVVIAGADGNYSVAGSHQQGQPGIAQLLLAAGVRVRDGDGVVRPRPAKVIEGK